MALGQIVCPTKSTVLSILPYKIANFKDWVGVTHAHTPYIFSLKRGHGQRHDASIFPPNFSCMAPQSSSVIK